jgi:hypothetical protein
MTVLEKITIEPWWMNQEWLEIVQGSGIFTHYSKGA